MVYSAPLADIWVIGEVGDIEPLIRLIVAVTRVPHRQGLYSGGSDGVTAVLYMVYSALPHCDDLTSLDFINK